MRPEYEKFKTGFYAEIGPCSTSWYEKQLNFLGRGGVTFFSFIFYDCGMRNSNSHDCNCLKLMQSACKVRLTENTVKNTADGRLSRP